MHVSELLHLAMESHVPGFEPTTFQFSDWGELLKLLQLKKYFCFRILQAHCSRSIFEFLDLIENRIWEKITQSSFSQKLLIHLSRADEWVSSFLDWQKTIGAANYGIQCLTKLALMLDGHLMMSFFVHWFHFTLEILWWNLHFSSQRFHCPILNILTTFLVTMVNAG